MVEVVKIDSNATGLKVAEETTLGTLPGSPVWYEMEPNSYSDFGGQLALVARNPINSGRQRKKGVITDLDASGGFNQDITFSNFAHMWPSLFMSTKEAKLSYDDTTVDDFASATTMTATGVDLTSAIDVGMMFFITGATTDANNGLHVVTAVSFSTDTTITFAGSTFTVEASAAGMTMQLVGYEYVADDANVVNSGGNLPTLTSDATTDLTNLGLQVGEFIFIGGDAASEQFTGAENNGFARVSSVADIATGVIQLDKSSGGADGETEMSSESLAGGETIQIFFGGVTRNVGTNDALFARRTWAIERQLGIPNPSGINDFQAEVLVGSVLNEFALNIAQADKLTADCTFISTDKANYEDSDTKPSESGTDASIETATAYNTSSDFTRIRLGTVRPSNNAAPTPLFTYVTELTLNVNNNASPNKAVGVLGAFDVTLGNFEVSASITAYFADIASVQAVRDNSDVTLDIALVKDFGTGAEARKTGLMFDVPLIALGDGRLEVTQDEAITLPLDAQAAEYENFGHTLLLCEYDYLPAAADT